MKQGIVFLVLFLLIPLWSFGGQADQQAQGLQALEAEDYTKAESVFRQLSASDPKNYSAFFNLALAETGLKRDADAITHYQKVLELKPDLYEAELNLGILYLRNKNPEAALPLLRKAVDQKPDKPRSKRYLADSLLATNDLAGAAEMYRQSLVLDSKLAAAELGLGQSLARQGKLDEALPHFRQAALLDPNLKSYLLETAAAFSKAGRTEDAILILKDFPENLAAREELGRLYLVANRPADAIPQFQAAVSTSPTTANRLALATAYLKNNQPELASPILQAELKSNPKDYDLLLAIGRITRDRHDYPAAASYFTSAAQVRPDSVEAWNEAAAADVLGGQFQRALSSLDQIHKLNAESAGNFYFRAISLDKLHQIKPAIASYRRFLELSGGKYPDQEFLARQRSKTLEREANR